MNILTRANKVWGLIFSLTVGGPGNCADVADCKLETSAPPPAHDCVVVTRPALVKIRAEPLMRSRSRINLFFWQCCP